MAVRLLSYDEVVEHLTRFNCVQVIDYGLAALWRTPKNFHFSVPQLGPDKRCDEYSWAKIIQDIAPYL